jgi:hypothetical protein
MTHILSFLVLLVISVPRTAHGLKDVNTVSSSAAPVHTERTDFTNPSPSNAATSSKLCKKYNVTAAMEYEGSHMAKMVKTTYEVTEIFQTISSFGRTTVYTPSSDGIPRLHFLEQPTRSEARNVTVFQSIVGAYDLNKEEKEKMVWYQVPCKDTTSTVTEEPAFQFAMDGRSEPCAAETLSYFASIVNKRLNSTATSLTLPAKKCQVLESCKVALDEEILLIYWLPEAEQGNSSNPAHIPSITAVQRLLNFTALEPIVTMTSALTFKGRDLYHLAHIDNLFSETTTSNIITTPSSVFKGPHVFTSPSIYIAHKAVTLHLFRELYLVTQVDEQYLNIKESWTSVIRPASIFPIHTSDVFTVALKHGNISSIEYAQKAARGEFQRVFRSPIRNVVEDHNSDSEKTTRGYDFHDMTFPLPAGAYFDARAADCWGRQSHCQTITEDNFRPRISLHRTVWKSIYKSLIPLLPKDFDCREPGLVDPPIALRPLGSDNALYVLPTPSISSTPNSGHNLPPVEPGAAPPMVLPRPTSQGDSPRYIRPGEFK